VITNVRNRRNGHNRDGGTHVPMSNRMGIEVQTGNDPVSDLMFSTELIQYAGRRNLASAWTLRDLMEDRGHALHHEAVSLLDEGTNHAVGTALDQVISRMRINHLRAQCGAQIPDPYGHPDLTRFQPSSHGLVPLNEFDLALRSPASGDSVFEMLPSLDQRNSSHWSLGLLQRLPETNPFIRLDPLMVAPRKGYRGYMAKMDVYGRPLTWRKVLELRDESSHRWMPARQDSDVAFTDAIWTPRDDEIHLRCEEVPTEKASAYRGSRYFHTIVNRRKRAIVHCDGAIRIFNTEEAAARAAPRSHVGNAGKVGVRIKLFQIDEELDSESWMELFKVFFVWNEDLAHWLDENVD
jgi:hypothetical protein